MRAPFGQQVVLASLLALALTVDGESHCKQEQSLIKDLLARAAGEASLEKRKAAALGIVLGDGEEGGHPPVSDLLQDLIAPRGPSAHSPVGGSIKTRTSKTELPGSAPDQSACARLRQFLSSNGLTESVGDVPNCFEEWGLGEEASGHMSNHTDETMAHHLHTELNKMQLMLGEATDASRFEEDVEKNINEDVPGRDKHHDSLLSSGLPTEDPIERLRGWLGESMQMGHVHAIIERARHAAHKLRLVREELAKVPPVMTDLGQFKGVDGAVAAYYKAARGLHLEDMEIDQTKDMGESSGESTRRRRYSAFRRGGLSHAEAAAAKTKESIIPKSEICWTSQWSYKNCVGNSCLVSKRLQVRIVCLVTEWAIDVKPVKTVHVRLTWKAKILPRNSRSPL